MKFIRTLILLSSLSILSCNLQSEKVDFNLKPISSATDLVSVSSHQSNLTVPRVVNVNANIYLEGGDLEFEFDQDMQRVSTESIVSEFEPGVPCYWYWVDPRHLSCDFGHSSLLKPATDYQLRIIKGVYSLDGIEMPEYTYSFTSERPTISSVSIQDWHSPIEPEIQINFNFGVNLQSLPNRVFLQDSKGRKIQVSLEPIELDASEIGKWNKDSRWQLVPKEILREGETYVVVQQHGISTPYGDLKSIDRIYNERHDEIKTFDQFRYQGVSCNWEDRNMPVKNRHCSAGETQQLLFTVPIKESSIESCQDALRELQVELYKVSHWARDYISLSARFARAEKRLHCLESIKDIFDRPLVGNTEIIIGTTDFDPTHGTAHSKEVLPQNETIKALHHSINIDKLEVKIEEIDHQNVKRSFIPNFTPEKNKLQFTEIIPDELQGKNQVSGRVIANNESDYRDAAFSIQKSPYNIILQHGRSSLLIFIADIYSNQPMANLPFSMEIIDRLNQKRTIKAKTDGHGIAMINRDYLASVYRYDAQFQLVFADGKIVEIDDAYGQYSKVEGVDSGSEYRSELPEDGKQYLWGVTDKPIYRPGETVRFVGFVRKIDGVKTEIGRVEDDSLLYVEGGEIACYEQCDSFFQREKPQMDEYGRIVDRFTLPKNTVDGRYQIILRGKGRYHDFSSSLFFDVANFKAQKIQVTAQPSKTTLTSEEKFAVTTQAEYFSGGPYKNAPTEVSLSVVTQEFDGVVAMHNDFSFHANNCVHCSANASQYFDSGLLNDAGVAKLTLDVPDNQVNYGTLNIQSSVRLDSGEKILSRLASVAYKPRPYFVGLKKMDWWIPIEKGITIQSRVVDLQGQIKPEIAIDYFIQESGRGQDNDKEPAEISIPCEPAFDTISQSNQCQWMPDVTGYYQIIARISYADGEKQETSSWHYFYSSKNQSSDKLTINTAKNNVKVGEKAEVKLNHGYQKASVLVTIHRNQVFDYWWQPLEPGLNTIEFEVKEIYAPGFDITLQVNYGDLASLDKSSGQQYAQVITQRFSVEVKDRVPQVIVKPEKTEYKPGEKIKLHLSNQSKQRSLVSIAVVDRSIIEQVSNPDYFKTKGSLVDTTKINWTSPDLYQLATRLYSGRIDKEEVAKLRSKKLAKVTITGSRLRRADVESDAIEHLSQPAPEDSMVQSAGKPLNIGGLQINPANLRKIFKESAYWNPSYELQGQQSSTVEFELPGNLTEWTVIAVSTFKDGEIDVFDTRFKTAKSLEVHADVPAQLTQGDSLIYQAEAFVKDPELKSLQLSSSATGGDSEQILAEKNEQFDGLKAFDRQAIELPISKVTGSHLNLLSAAKSGDKEDAIMQSVAVYSTLVPRNQSSYAILPEESSIAVPKPLYFSDNHASLHVSASGSIRSQLSGTFDYMSDYPHQCWEQKLSRALVAALQIDLKQTRQTELALLNEHINDALGSIGEFQAANGGMAFFGKNEDHVSVFLSAYTYKMLTRLKTLGYAVDDYHYAKLGQYLEKELSHPSYAYSEATSVIVLNALAQNQTNHSLVINRLQSHVSNAKKMNADIQGLLLETAALLPEEESAVTLLNQLIIDSSRVTPKKRLLKTDSVSRWYLFDFESKRYCSVISGLTQASSDKKTVYQFINAVLEKRRQGQGDFGNTLSNAYCATAIYDYIKQYEKTEGFSEIALRLGQDIGSLSQENPQTSIAVSMNEPMDLQIKTEPQSSAYLQARLEYQYDAMQTPKIANGFSLRREYFQYTDKQWIPLGQSPLEQGDIVKVRLTINNPLFRRFVAITDYLAGGFFALDENLATGAPGELFESLAISYFLNEKQLGARTAKFYAELLPPGEYLVEYLVKAKHQGEFSILSARVEEMYDDDVYATSNSQKIIIQ